MTPGPATYRTRQGFDSIEHSPNNRTSSKQFFHKRSSIPHFSCKLNASEFINDSGLMNGGSLTGAGNISQDNLSVTHGKVRDPMLDKEKFLIRKQDIIMAELHERMVQITKTEAEELKKDNKIKEEFLKERDTYYKDQMRQLSPDRAPTDNSVSNSILNGDVIVKILRVGAGRNLGPGVYSVASKDKIQRQSSHNIKDLRQYQELDKVGKRKNSPMNKKERDARKLVDSFYDSQKNSFIQMFQEDEKIYSCPDSRRQSALKLTPCKNVNLKGFNSPNETANTTGESKESKTIKHQTLSTKNLERIKQLIRDTELGHSKLKSSAFSNLVLPTAVHAETSPKQIRTPNEKLTNFSPNGIMTPTVIDKEPLNLDLPEKLSIQ